MVICIITLLSGARYSRSLSAVSLSKHRCGPLSGRRRPRPRSQRPCEGSGDETARPREDVIPTQSRQLLFTYIHMHICTYSHPYVWVSKYFARALAPRTERKTAKRARMTAACPPSYVHVGGANSAQVIKCPLRLLLFHEEAQKKQITERRVAVWETRRDMLIQVSQSASQPRLSVSVCSSHPQPPFLKPSRVMYRASCWDDTSLIYSLLGVSAEERIKRTSRMFPFRAPQSG